MGRPPSNGAPAFRFTPTEVAEMETILQEHHLSVPSRDILTALAEKFSKSADRSGQVVVQMKQVWNWFQNRRYAVRAKLNKSFSPAKLSVSTMPQKDPSPERRVPQPVPHSVPQPVLQPVPTSSALNIGRNMADNVHMEFEAKSARDGAWYDVATFLSHRYFETGDPEVLVRFSGFGPEEDEWVNVSRLIRQRSLPCESSECVAVLPGDLILCFQEGNEQALYFDAHVLDAQRRRHDIRGCRCRFLVRYDHDQSEEIVPLRKVCRRPETDYRLQQLRPATAPTPLDQHKTGEDPSIGSNTAKDSSSAETTSKQHEAEEDGNVLPNEDPSLGSSAVRGPGSPEMMPKQIEVEENAAALSTVAPPSQADNASVITGAKHLGTGNGKIASTGNVENSDVNSGNAALTNGVIISSVAGGSSEA